MTSDQAGRWSLVGTGSVGRFLLERWQLRPDFPLVATGDAVPADRVPLRCSGLRQVPDWRQLLADPQVDGLILTVPLELRCEMMLAAAEAGKRVLVEGAPCADRSEASRLTGDLPAGVFHLRRVDPDFHAARAAISGGRLGRLQSLRWICCEYSLPAGVDLAPDRPTWTDALRQTGPWLFDQLSQLADGEPVEVIAWPDPAQAGFQARFNYSSGLTAWIDLQRASLCGLRTGWVVEGATGACRNGRLMTLADDGELLEEEIAPFSEAEDVFAELRQLASCPQIARQSLNRAMRTGAAIDAIRDSIRERRPVQIPPNATSFNL